MGPRIALLIGLVVVASSATARAASGGAGLFVGGQPLPVVSSDVSIDVSLGVARGVVQQRFRNDRGQGVEAVYVFPLPPGAAVQSMTATVGGATIRGVIARRAEAAAAYQDAVASGRAAALTELERPGVFTQSLAPVPAGGEVVVTLRWQVALERRAGAWELAHPLVVGARYVAGTPTGKPTSGVGTAPDTDRASDGSRLSPASGLGTTTPYRVALHLDDADQITSPSHELSVTRSGAGAAVAVDDRTGNRELVVRWTSRRPEQVRAFVEPAGGGAYVAVLVEPGPGTAAPARRPGRAWVVVVDRSPSQAGAPAAAARLVGHALLDAVPPGDAVAVVSVGQGPGPATADRAALHRALDRLPPSSSDLTRALASTLARLPRRPAPQVVLITDGLVADDAAAIERAAASGLVVHTIGVGAAPNRWLLGAIAARTGGTVGVVASVDEVAAVAAHVVDSDGALPVTVDWRTPAVLDTEASAPRVGPGGAALLIGVDPGGVPSGEVEVAIGSRRLRARIEQRAGTDLAATWAALRVRRLYAAGDRDAATTLALERGLVTPTTALLAATAAAGEPVRSVVAVPVPVPAGARLDGLRDEADDRDDDVRARPTGGATAPKLPAAPPPPVVDAATGTTYAGVAGNADGDAEVAADAPRTAVEAKVVDDQLSLGPEGAVALSRHFTTVGLALAARLDEPAPALALSVAGYRRLPRVFAVGLRLDASLAALEADPVTAAALVSLATVPARLPVQYDVGAGLGWSGGLGAAVDVGLRFGRGGLGLALRGGLVIGPGVRSTTVGLGVDAAF
ncbi:MAG: VIT domain-containing protein [Kofleriaceae bacterium]